jgi:RNA polymerase sigma-70 factor (ECF subfamily)
MTILRTDVLERLSRIVRQERGALVAVARGEGLDPEEAVECVQDALATFLSRDEIDAEHEVASLRTIAKNAARPRWSGCGHFRRAHRRRMPHAPIEDTPVPAIDPNAEVLLAHAEDVVRLRACVAELCSIQRAVITLRSLEERSGEDVAAQLGITRKHVDVLVHRAKASLRVCMRHAK